jgi:hypothetical protein
VQCVKVAAGVSEVTTDLFDPTKSRDIKQSKLRVILIPPAKPPSPVPEGNESLSEPPSPADFASAQKNRDFESRLGNLNATPTSRQGTKVVKRQGPRAGLGILSILVVALLAFLAAHFGEATVVPLLKEKMEVVHQYVAGLMKKSQ